jgi:hypothetical protein
MHFQLPPQTLLEWTLCIYWQRRLPHEMHEMPVKTYKSWRAGRPWKASSGTVRMTLLHRSRSCSNDRPLNRFPSRLSIWLLAKSLETKNELTGSGVFSGDDGTWQCGIGVQHFVDSLCLRLQGLMWWVSHLDAVIIWKPFAHPILSPMGNSRWSQIHVARYCSFLTMFSHMFHYVHSWVSWALCINIAWKHSHHMNPWRWRHRQPLTHQTTSSHWHRWSSKISLYTVAMKTSNHMQ